MKANARLRLFTCLLVGAVRLPVLAFDYPMSSGSIRDAYMLGKRKDFRTAEFFRGYIHHLPKPGTGSHVATISAETPRK